MRSPSTCKTLVVKSLPDTESDAALVARFARLRDERAFAELVQRHGPMVLGVCSRMLGQRQDAEDALQAVFLTLSAKSKALARVRCVAGWLHNVAVRISLNLLKMNRRREQALRSFQNERLRPQRDESHDLKELLDEELAQLPARLKETVIVRDLEGFSRSEAAKRLGVSLSTVDNRLSRGRKLLRDRLVRRGVTVGSAGLATALSQCAGSSPALGIELAQQTVRNAQLFSAGKSAEGISVATNITSLAQGMLNTMFLTKLSTTVCILALAAALVLGASPVSKMIGLTSNVRAGEFFFDDFEDGSVSDGRPVSWVPEFPPFHLGTRQVVDGSYIVTPPSFATPFPGAPANAAEADSNKPANPQASALIPAELSEQGRVSLGVIHQVTGPEPTQVAFREFSAVPEPSSVALGSLGFVALAGFVVRTRLLRIRSPH